MTRLKSRPFSPRLQWQLEQQGVPSLLARIYAARGVQAKSELDYAAKLLIPPAQLTHAGEAAVLLADALEAQAHILIVADYDCDGATACAVGVRALRAMADLRYGIPGQSTDSFVHAYGEMSLAGTFIDAAGQPLGLARRKGN